MLGFESDFYSVDSEDFFTDRHFQDYQILVVEPAGAFRGREYDYSRSIYDGRLKLDSGAASSFKTQYLKTAEKVAEFIRKGGLALVVARALPTLRYDPDGRGHYVLSDLNKSMPWQSVGISTAVGANIQFSNEEPFSEFWNATSDMWTYAAILNGPNIHRPLATVRGHKDEVVSNALETENAGLAFVIPVPEVVNATPDEQATFISAICRLHEALNTTGAIPQLPEWAADYQLPGESELRNDIAEAEAEVITLQMRVEDRQKSLATLGLHKVLVTGHDSALENAVDRVFTELGFAVQSGPKGRVDRTATLGERKFAIEVQGVKRGAKEDHARALTIWVNEVAMEDGQEPKGLLVVNAGRDTPLVDRGSIDPWPGQTLKICERHGYCAITGVQLLGLYLHASTAPAARDDLIERLFKTEGRFDGFEDWREFLSLAGD